MKNAAKNLVKLEFIARSIVKNRMSCMCHSELLTEKKIAMIKKYEKWPEIIMLCSIKNTS